MEATVSTSFIYAILGGIFSVLALIYYQKVNQPKLKRKPLYYAGIFFVVANVIYHVISPNDVTSQMTMKNIFNPVICEMKTGQPEF
jgi:hypothetical protein|tara:strand:+ start:496 stop:753 length:258 start_codon:yes stop_codon:yes gene_type:complete